jgi:hypothetical protein
VDAQHLLEPIQTTPEHPIDCIYRVLTPMHRNEHTMNPKFIYINATQLAHEININPNNISAIIKKWKHHPNNPTPKPDAYVIDGNYKKPLWRQESLPQWHTWKTQRDTIVTELQAQERANTAIKASLESLT